MAEKKAENGNGMIAAGLGVGAVGTVGALVAGAVCPLCIVATPALLGVGLVQKWRARRGSQSSETAIELSADAPPQPQQ